MAGRGERELLDARARKGRPSKDRVGDRMPPVAQYSSLLEFLAGPPEPRENSASSRVLVLLRKDLWGLKVESTVAETLGRLVAGRGSARR